MMEPRSHTFLVVIKLIIKLAAQYSSIFSEGARSHMFVLVIKLTIQLEAQHSSIFNDGAYVFCLCQVWDPPAGEIASTPSFFVLYFAI